MGLICPLTIILKIELRNLFGPDVDLGWDEPIPREQHDAWVEILSMFLSMVEILIGRAARPAGVEDVPELVGFGDGSLLAYACVIYARWKVLKKCARDPDEFVVRIICGKARVTPVRGTTAPRSEISGFLILTRLLKVVIDAMEFKPSRVTLAVDSQCSISALQKSGGLLAPYFASRVSESVTNLSQLPEEILVDPIQHVPGPMNPADIPTRSNTLPDDVRPGSCLLYTSDAADE